MHPLLFRILWIVAVCYGVLISQAKLREYQGATPADTVSPRPNPVFQSSMGALGLSNLYASSVWIGFLQSYAYEETQGTGPSPEYFALKAIVESDPAFLPAFELGGPVLAVFKKDVLGADDLLNRWIQRFPRSWYAHYLLGYHYLFNKEDRKEAARSWLAASVLPRAPYWLASSGLREWGKAKSTEEAMRVAIYLFEALRSDAAKKRIADRLRGFQQVRYRRAWEKALAKFKTEYDRSPQTLAEASRFFQLEPLGVPIPNSLAFLFASPPKFVLGSGQLRLVGGSLKVNHS